LIFVTLALAMRPPMYDPDLAPTTAHGPPVPASLVNILESISDVIVVLDRSWRFVYLNRRALELAQQPYEALVGRSVGEKFRSVLGTEVDERCRNAMAEQRAVHFNTAGLIDGRWYEVHAYPSPEGLTIYGRDVTERRLAEDKFKNFMDNSPAVAFMKDEEGKYVYINKVFEQRLQMKQENVLGRTDFALWPAEAAQAFRNADQAVLAAGKTLEFVEIVPDPDGTDHSWQSFKFLVKDAAGARYLGGMAVDITVQRQAEARLKENAGQLKALSGRLLEVQEAERRYLARELHDEVGQVLTGVQLSMEMVRRSLPQDLRAGVEQTQKSLKDLAGQVRDLSLRLRPTMLDDLGLLPALLWHLDRFTVQAGIHIAIQQSGIERRFPPEVETAAYRIVQEALTNVARHAGVQEATLRLWCDEKILHIEVKDRGTGFEPKRVRAEGRSGGLSGMYERAVLLGGRLDIVSHLGAGTCISAELPTGGTGKQDRKDVRRSPTMP
jgi:PAS domain S-box-containing protein